MRAAGRLDRRDEPGGRDEQRSADLLTELYLAHYELRRSSQAVGRLSGKPLASQASGHIGDGSGVPTVRGRTFRLG